MASKSPRGEPRATSPSLTKQVADLRDLLCRLEPKQFEMLLVHSLEKILDRRVFPFRAGYQFGSDMGSDPLEPPTIRLEAKRWQKKLDQRSLLGEIDQVAKHDSELDLWIVGTTAAVDMKDISAIRKAGITHGIGTEVIDLSESKMAKLPQVLWLALPTAEIFVEEKLGRTDAQQLRSILEALAVRHEFEDSLRAKLIHATQLFESVAELMRLDLRERLDDKRLSRLRFNQEIHDPSIFVPRPKVTSSIVGWYEQEPRQDLCLIEGREGVGKSWMGFDALSHLAKVHELLPIGIPAKQALRAPSLEDVIAEQIHAVMLALDVPTWKRKVQRWLASPLRSSLLLYFDGINEEHQAPWHQLLDEAAIGAVPILLRQQRSDSGRLPPIAAIASCRSQYWNAHFRNRPSVHSVPVGPFSMTELQARLEHAPQDLGDFQKEVQELMRVPRITETVLRHYDALITSGEITVDRLLYEEWKYKAEQKTRGDFEEGEFRALIKDLAQDFVSGKIRSRSHEIRRLLGFQEAEKIFIELTSSGVLEPAGDGQYRLETTRLHHALGLLLYQELSDQPEVETSLHRESIDEKLESMQGLDEHASILAAAIFAAVIDADRSKSVLFALLQSFGSLRNVSRLVRDRVNGYLPAIGPDLLELAEYCVLHEEGSRQTLEFIEHILIRWSREGIADELIRQACRRWIGFLRWKSTFEPPNVLEHRSQRLEMLLGQPPAKGAIDNHGSSFWVVETGNVSFLQRLAVTLVSARGGRIEPEFFRDWALAETADGFFRGKDAELFWLLRFLPSQQMESLVQTVEGMLAVENPLWQEAAYWLADLIGTPCAEVLKSRSDFQPGSDSVDPCAGEDWHTLTHCFEDPGISLETKAHHLDRLALDPSFELEQEAIDKLINELVQVAYLDDAEDKRVKAPNALARWRPADEADAWMRKLRQFDRDVDYELGQLCVESADDESEEAEARRREHQQALGRLHGWASHQKHLILLLEDGDVECVEAAWRQFVSRPKQNRDLQGIHLQDPTEIELFRTLLAVAKSELCAELVLHRPAGEGSAARCLLALPLALTTGQALRCWQKLMERSDEEILEKLQLLSSETLHLDPASYRRLVAIARSDESAATEVAAFAQLSEDATLVRELIDSGVGLRLDAVDREYRLGYGGIGPELPMARLLDEAPANFVSHYFAKYEDEDIELFAEAVRVFPRREGPGWHQSFLRPGLANRCRFDEEALSTALEHRPDVLDTLMAECDSTEPDAVSPLQASHHLYVAICDHFLTRDRDRALKLLDSLRRIKRTTEGMLGSTTRKPSDLCWRLMVKYAEEPEVSWRLEEDLDALTNDSDLERVSQLFELSQDQWLWRKIENDLNSDRQLLKARAMTLAGYAHDVERAIERLERLDVPSRSWLTRVREKALSAARNGSWSRYWFDEFLRRSDPKESWAAFRLFLRCVDRRYSIWRLSALEAQSVRYFDRSRKAAHLRVNLNLINTLIDERWKKHTKDKFCHTKASGRIFPWMGAWEYPVRYDRQMVSGRLESEDVPRED